ncbi:hypothetical protein PHOSAC3_120039 [Mesotoga infera]|nr:hypothetical protein PHOSAC3_120039 [Mesotoga infera]
MGSPVQGFCTDLAPKNRCTLKVKDALNAAKKLRKSILRGSLHS